MVIELELTIPPGEGYSPYQGQISVWAKSFGWTWRTRPPARGGVGVATRFRED
jgi:hypothetical protein